MHPVDMALILTILIPGAVMYFLLAGGSDE